MWVYLWFSYILKKFNVIGFDIDNKNRKFKIRKSYLSHISDNQLKKSLKINFTATNNFKLINKIDIIILCLPTPLTNKLIPDLSYIKNTFGKIFSLSKKRTIANFRKFNISWIH